MSDSLVEAGLVVQHRKGLAGLHVSVEQEGDVSPLPPHVVEVHQRRVQPDRRATLVYPADVRRQNPRHQRHCGQHTVQTGQGHFQDSQSNKGVYLLSL